jgi:hypothetical protein
MRQSAPQKLTLIQIPCRQTDAAGLDFFADSVSGCPTFIAEPVFVWRGLSLKTVVPFMLTSIAILA